MKKDIIDERQGVEKGGTATERNLVRVQELQTIKVSTLQEQ
jgi:hypothetical protein